MKIILKLLGVVVILAGSLINGLGVLSSLQGKDALGATFGGGVFIALGISIIVMNKKGYSW